MDTPNNIYGSDDTPPLARPRPSAPFPSEPGTRDPYRHHSHRRRRRRRHRDSGRRGWIWLMIFAFLGIYGIYLFVFKPKERRPAPQDQAAVPAVSNAPSEAVVRDVSVPSTALVARVRVDHWRAARSEYTAARKLLAAGQTNEAMARLESALAHNPLNGEARSELGWIQFQSRDYAAAETNLLQALGAEPERGPEILRYESDDRPASDMILFLTYQNQNRYEDASAIIEWMLARDPGSPRLHQMAANVCLKLDRPAEAVPHLAKVISVQRDNGAALKDLADAYVKLENYDKAMEMLQQVIKLNESDTAGYFKMVNCQVRAGRGAEAVQTLEKAATACNPSDVVNWAEGNQALNGIRTNDAYRAWRAKH